MLLDLDAAAAALNVCKNSLRTMLADAPVDLPGAPVQIGRGRTRKHLRWHPEDLRVWWGAYCAWQRGETHRPRRRGAR
jgi:hypothetical protein